MHAERPACSLAPKEKSGDGTALHKGSALLFPVSNENGIPLGGEGRVYHTVSAARAMRAKGRYDFFVSSPNCGRCGAR